MAHVRFLGGAEWRLTTQSGHLGRQRAVYGAAMTAKHCYVKFEVATPEALSHLARVVRELQSDKTARSARSNEEWAQLFSVDELSTFWQPDETERQQWNEFWFSTPLAMRHSADMPKPPWHFESMIEVILEGDYDLVGVRELAPNEASVEFDPHGYPFGGTGALRALIRAFGHRVLGADDGTGYEPGDPMGPHWVPPAR